MMKYWSDELPEVEVPADVGSNPTTPMQKEVSTLQHIIRRIPEIETIAGIK